MKNKLNLGDIIPPFQAKDQEGLNVTEEDLIGTTLVIYFYPQDETPGCTAEACSFRDDMRKFDALATLIIGVSPDTVESHKKFITNHKLKYSLLSDPKKEMCRLFGVLDGQNVIRSTFLIDSEGIVRWFEKPVKVEGHTERVLKAIKEFCPTSVIKFDTFNADYAEFLQGGFKTTESEAQIRERIMKKFNLKDKDLGKKNK